MDAKTRITEKINSYQDWRGEMLADLRKLINQTAPELTEDFKWNVPVWTHKGLVCGISAFKNHVKINFFKGAYLSDPDNMFNSGLDSKEHRSINYGKEDKPDSGSLKKFINDAVLYNES